MILDYTDPANGPVGGVIVFPVAGPVIDQPVTEVRETIILGGNAGTSISLTGVVNDTE